ncbi:MAG: hypothetical protein O7H40_04075 [Gammaproteobacteria bacterium]|nr:hypothetical protein [Gammaproteobacteria bacterium]
MKFEKLALARPLGDVEPALSGHVVGGIRHEIAVLVPRSRSSWV